MKESLSPAPSRLGNCSSAPLSRQILVVVRQSAAGLLPVNYLLRLCALQSAAVALLSDLPEFTCPTRHRYLPRPVCLSLCTLSPGSTFLLR
ncbi:Hypothetical protein SMAX5B_009175 [Scophthalmus maximus]|uniref:Uncharacterized protein n=1 Tax=Scophthalmus maximus TaxID=52904 RepID=A0A2U9C4Y1_SCOMX|nr:Hypothetical protein SMAX5B_009175 [Scophthalmus maximus]